MSTRTSNRRSSKTPLPSPKTIHQHVALARRRLREAGIPSDEADLDARLLAEFVLEWTTERFFTSANEAEPEAFAERYLRLVARRAAREPFAYIVGRQEFWGLSIEVSPDVLIPRPETELIVEAALERFPALDGPVLVADVCTGSGCIAVAFADERPAARVIAGDISLFALQVAQRNANRYGVSDQVECRPSNVLETIDGPVDLVVSNPPYVRDDERSIMQPEVRDYEPAVALFAGADGLDVVRRLVEQAPGKIRSGGYLIFEFGFGQDEGVERLVEQTAGLELVELRRDLQGIARTAIARRV
jgi:release factor glutamine methyltransferase